LALITKDHAQEGLSRAYVQAISAAARVNASLGGEFDYGFDGVFNLVVDRGDEYYSSGIKRFINSGYALDFQLKCSWKWHIKDNHVVWSIKTKTYNDLVFRKDQPGGRAVILILMCLPKDENTWVQQNEDGMALKKCGYYYRIDGSRVHNENSTKTIRIPCANVFTPAALIKELDIEQKRMRGRFE
jgi:hypothetical protein